MSDTKRKVSAWVPAALYDKVEKAGYTSPTIAVTKAFELLVREQTGDSPETIGDNAETPGDNWGTLRRQLETQISSLKKENERLITIIDKAPDPSELAELRGNYTGLQLVLEEKEKRIEELNKHIEDISPFANYYKNKELKQIEAPAIEKVKPWWKFW